MSVQFIREHALKNNEAMVVWLQFNHITIWRNVTLNWFSNMKRYNNKHSYLSNTIPTSSCLKANKNWNTIYLQPMIYLTMYLLKKTSYDDTKEHTLPSHIEEQD